MTDQANVVPASSAPPTLLDHITALEGQDPLMVGATGYLDDVFTSRLVADTE